MTETTPVKLTAPLFCALALLPALALDQATDMKDLKIGFVSIERILKDSPPAVKANKKLEKEFQARGQEIEKMTKQARDLQAVLEKESVTMSESDRRTKEGELARLNRDLQRMQREFREELNLRRNEEFQQIMQEAVFRSPRIDITEKVLKALTEK
jgi:outer membrane protein